MAETFLACLKQARHETWPFDHWLLTSALADRDCADIAALPFAPPEGVIFIPGKNTWHGAGHEPIAGLRKSIIVNYVTPAWREKWELA